MWRMTWQSPLLSPLVRVTTVPSEALRWRNEHWPSWQLLQHHGILRHLDAHNWCSYRWWIQTDSVPGTQLQFCYATTEHSSYAHPHHPAEPTQLLTAVDWQIKCYTSVMSDIVQCVKYMLCTQHHKNNPNSHHESCHNVCQFVVVLFSQNQMQI